jgi:hypothetical protein
MSGPAYVQNTEAVEAVRVALAKFGHQVSEGLTELEAEMRRMLDWLEHDRPRYWKNAVREAWDGVEIAKQNLHRCLMYPIGDERPSCSEERDALKAAQMQLGYCQEKVERLRAWCRELRHELFEYEGRVTQLKELTEMDVPQGIATLGKILDRIAEYQLLQAPAAGSGGRVASMTGEAAPSPSPTLGVETEPADEPSLPETPENKLPQEER